MQSPPAEATALSALARHGWWFVLLAAVPVLLAVAAMPPGLPQRLMYHAGMVAAVGVMAIALKLYRPDRARGVWRLIVAAWAATVLGGIFGWAQQPLPETVGYLAGYMLGVAAYLRLIRLRTGGRDTTGLLDAAIVATGVGALAWMLVVWPLLRDVTVWDDATVLGVVYPILGIFLVFLIARLVLVPGGTSPSLRLTLAGVTVSMSVDVALLVDRSVETPIGVHHAGYLLALVLAASAALHPSMRSLTDAPVQRRRSRYRPGRLPMLAFAGLSGPVVFVLQPAAAHGELLPVVGATSLTMFGLILWRMARGVREVELAHRQTAQGLERAHILSRTGAALVAAEQPDAALAAASRGIAELTGVRPDEVGVLVTDHDVVIHTPGDDLDVEVRAAIDTLRSALGLRLESLAAVADLHGSERRFRALVQNAADGIVVTSATGHVSYVSPSVHRLTGYDSDELVGADGFTFIVADDVPRAADLMTRALDSPGQHVSGRMRINHKNGSVRTIEVGITNLLAVAGVQGLVANFRDVTDSTALEEALHRQAFYDVLTGLANRALLRDRLERAMSRSRGSDGLVALLLVDVDDFKGVNDSRGHDAGDALLCELARRMERCVRASDTVARLGGDEFALLLEDLDDPDQAAATAGRLVTALAQPIDLGGSHLKASVSVGIAIAEEGDIEQLLRRADLAMYAAKAAGGNMARRYEAGMQEAAVSRIQVRADLERALEHGELFCAYQPIIDVANGTVASVEALVRWQHPERGLVPPLEFIGAAEETGLIHPLGRFVLDQACGQAAAWVARFGERSPRVAVNVSSVQMAQPGFADQVRDMLRRHGLAGRHLTIEITETGLMESDEAMRTRLDSLRTLGVEIAIDDFGTGYSSLSYLQRLRVDVLKIDRAFVAGLDQGPEASAVAHAIIKLAQIMRLRTVAEGVETRQQLDRLAALGCDQAQGYLLHRPLSAEQVTAILAHGGTRPVRSTRLATSV